MSQQAATATAPTTGLWVRRAYALAWFTVAFNSLEALAAILFGLEDGSLTLVGFGVDSLIEVASAGLVLWRLHSDLGQGQLSRQREQRATLGIGVLFLLLAGGAAIGAALRLWSHARPATGTAGLVVAAVSLSFMFALWWGKRKAAQALDSSTLEKDAACSMACIHLSVVLLIGSGLMVIAPSLWWVDAVAALCLSLLIGREGYLTVKAARSPSFSGGCGCTG